MNEPPNDGYGAVRPEEEIPLYRPAQDPEIIEDPSQRHRREPESQQYRYAPRPRRRLLPLVLFLATCVSTYLTGGLTYAVAVMAILLAHEMGHFVQSVRYGIPASLPFFIPMPYNPIGTMGAVIVQRSGVADRRALFDIAITGPLAGLVLALPVTWWGVKQADIVLLPPDRPVMMFGDPLLVKWMTHIIHGPLPAGTDLVLNPILFAGWVGIFITALNLFPIGQLDGGHILYSLLLGKAHSVARQLYLFAVVFVIVGGAFWNSAYYAWTLMLVLIWMMGVRHPPTANDHVPLGTSRTVLGWITLMFIFIGFTPTPMYTTEPAQEEEQQPEMEFNERLEADRLSHESLVVFQSSRTTAPFAGMRREVHTRH